MKDKVYHSDPDILGGTVVFVGTRVPVRSLFDHLEEDITLESFLDDFPSVTREQCLAVLEDRSCVLAETSDNAGMKRRVYHSDPEILGGTVVFIGTRVPVRSLFDYLERGRTLDYFLDSFPSVKREQCLAALEEAKEHAVEEGALAHPA